MPGLSLLTEILLYSAALLGYLPLAPWLQRLPALSIPAAILFAVIGGRRGLCLKERPALFVAVGGFLYYAAQFNHHNVAVPAANLLTILLAIRLAGEKSPRNFLQSIALALFCLAASTLFDLSPRFIIYLFLLLLILTVSLVLLTFQGVAPEFRPDGTELRTIVTVALLQPLSAIPLIIFLFFILPRTQLPLWQGISMAGSDRPGISETVQPGDKSVISSSKATMFRVEIAQLPPEELYWRVTVLNALSGSSWVRRPPPPDEHDMLRDGSEVRQTIILEPGKVAFLPTLNLPQTIAGARGAPTADRLFPATMLVSGRRSYSVSSQSRGALLTTSSVDRNFYTTLPDNIPARLLALSRAAAAGEKSDEQRLRRLKEAFLALKLTYGATGLPTGATAMEQFLFAGRNGHCELFATAFATALRVAGIPARLVGGYYGGDYNELAGYYAVADDRAHLWVEAWLAGKGWVTVDPSSFAANFSEARRVKSSALMHRLGLFADTLSYYWTRAVISYDLESQFSAVSRAGAGLRSLKTGKLPLRRLAVGSGCLLLLVAVFHLLTRKRPTPEEQLLQAFRRAMHTRYGLVMADSAGLHETMKGIDNEAVQEFVAIYTRAIYRDRSLTEAERGRLKELLESIRRYDRG